MSEAKATRVSWHVQVLQIWNKGFDIFRHKKEQHTEIKAGGNPRCYNSQLNWQYIGQLIPPTPQIILLPNPVPINSQYWKVCYIWVYNLNPTSLLLYHRETDKNQRYDNKNLSAEHDWSMNTYETRIQGDEQGVEHRYEGWHFNFQNSRHEDTPIHVYSLIYITYQYLSTSYLYKNQGYQNNYSRLAE